MAIRLGGYALDACGEATDLGPGRGPTAHDTCHWLRKIEGLADGSRDLPPALKTALSALFWRLVDTTRGTALGEVDDMEWLGPFAAWWALVIDRPAMLLQLATALPMMAEGALARCCERAELLRTAVSSGSGEGEWGSAASEALESLHALNTELSHALLGLAEALLSFNGAAGRSRTSKPCVSRWCAQASACRARSPIRSKAYMRANRTSKRARCRRPQARTRSASQRSWRAPFACVNCRSWTSGSPRSARSPRRCSKARCARPSAVRRLRRQKPRNKNRRSFTATSW
ncbi:MAG: hypothetical protein WDO74_28245 [Pseudomonadota bacterium]